MSEDFRTKAASHVLKRIKKREWCLKGSAYCVKRASPLRLKPIRKLPTLKLNNQEIREQILEKKFRQHKALNKIKQLGNNLSTKKSASGKISDILLSLGQKPIYAKYKKPTRSLNKNILRNQTSLSIKTLEHISSKSPIKCLRDLHREKLREYKSRILGSKEIAHNLSYEVEGSTKSSFGYKLHVYNSSFSDIDNPVFDTPGNSGQGKPKRAFDKKFLKLLKKKSKSFVANGNRNATFTRWTPMLIRGESSYE
ncbi:unnamed protein product [Moneuplotes crassus]|uniref:Uncharacterized protein n=1 Tax=Euplotes crassus TaxID=5936 RepID=A0AAD1XNE2_EUPCR|nr:unnamed protein product [Moneuplotes crassus]